MGLAQREIEKAGITTITLSNIPDLTASLSVPRLAAIEYPFGRTLGQPGDREGQKAVLRATLRAVEAMDTPGSISHLPFEWPQSAREARAEPAQPPPIVTHLKRNPWHLPKFIAREIPQAG